MSIVLPPPIVGHTVIALVALAVAIYVSTSREWWRWPFVIILHAIMLVNVGALVWHLAVMPPARSPERPEPAPPVASAAQPLFPRPLPHVTISGC
jgi:hypothetical protein